MKRNSNRFCRALWSAAFLLLCFAFCLGMTALAEQPEGGGMTQEAEASDEESTAAEKTEEETLAEETSTTPEETETSEESGANPDEASREESSEEPTEAPPENQSEEPATSTVPVTELDLGEYYDKMYVGGKQLLYVTVLPFDADEKKISYDSSDTSVAEINGMGRITAKAAGKCRITVSCGGVSTSFLLTVEEPESESTEGVESIEISNHAEQLEVGKTLTLQATVLPVGILDAELSYRSSDSRIATVSRTGEVKGISAGKVRIAVSAGNVTEWVELTVVVKTTQICTGSIFYTLKPGESVTLGAYVLPVEAPQTLSYRSSDESVVTVDEDGTVHAAAVGEAGIIIKNEDMSAAVTVIVNSGNGGEDQPEETLPSETEGNPKTWETVLDASVVPEITKEHLRALYRDGSQLLVKGEGYSFLLYGEELVNFALPLQTALKLQESEKGLTFILNEGNPLPGPVHLHLNEPSSGKLYLYDEEKQCYALLRTADNSDVTLTTPGSYVFSRENLAEDHRSVWTYILGGSALALLGCAAYIIVRKKYWFW